MTIEIKDVTAYIGETIWVVAVFTTPSNKLFVL